MKIITTEYKTYKKWYRLIFSIYVLTSLVAIVFSVIKAFTGKSYSQIPTLVSMLLFTFGGAKESLIDKYVVMVSNVKENRIKITKSLYSALGTIPFIVVLFSFFYGAPQKSIHSLWEALGYAILTFVVLSIFKGLICASTKVLGISYKSVWGDIDLGKDRVLDVIYSSAGRKKQSEEYNRALCKEMDYLGDMFNMKEFDEKYLNPKEEDQTYTIELRITQKTDVLYYYTRETLGDDALNLHGKNLEIFRRDLDPTIPLFSMAPNGAFAMNEDEYKKDGGFFLIVVWMIVWYFKSVFDTIKEMLELIKK